MGKEKTLLEQLIDTPESKKQFAQEQFILECTEFICKLMKEKGITRAELADRLGKTKGYISQLLNGRYNMTIRTLADIFYVLDVEVELTPKKDADENMTLTYYPSLGEAVTYKMPRQQNMKLSKSIFKIAC